MGRIPAPADPSKEDAMSELDPDRPEPGLDEEDDDAVGKFGPDVDDDKFGPDKDDDDEAEEQFGTEGDEE
jgi:hypothetical protein